MRKTVDSTLEEDLDVAVDDWEEDEWDDADDYVYVPEDRGVVRRIFAIVLFIALFVLGVFGYAGFWLRSQISPATDKAAPVSLVIPKDSGLTTVARLLEEKEIITNATIFRYYAKWQNIGTIRAGEYDKFYKNDSMDHVIDRLKLGPIPPKFSEIGPIPEGLWLTDTIARINEKYPEMSIQDIATAFQSVAHSKYQAADKPFDGLLFPAKYRVEDPDKGDPAKLIDQMVKKFDQVGAEIGLGDATGKLSGFSGKVAISPYDAITVASLIEAEAKVPEDRARISRVIYNRLSRTPAMKLEIDATVPFALQEHKQELTKDDLAFDSPFNTRKNPGLPPTPINSPGRDSLEAALNPSIEPGAELWLYYVLIDEKGNHFFTGNYNEFLKKQQESRNKGLL